MESDENVIENICRVCLTYTKSENMFDLFDSSNRDELSDYGKSIEIMCDILNKSDGLPKKMCTECLLRLKQAIILKKTCENSQKVLRKLTKNFSLQSDEMKQNVTEYVLFKTYFPDDELSNDSGSEHCAILNKSVSKIYVNSLRSVYEISEDNSSDNEPNFDDFPKINVSMVNQSPIEFANDDDLLNTMEEIVNSELKIPIGTVKKNSEVNKDEKALLELKLRGNKKEPQNMVCTNCNKIFTKPRVFIRHQKDRICYRIKPSVICEVCGKVFATYSHLQSHQGYMHSLGKLYSCDQCEFKASRPQELMEHIRFHTGERPFACDKCGLTFRRRYIWKKHSLYHGEKTVQCPACPKKFFVKAEMKDHYNNIHERITMYKCTECDVTYAKSTTVRKHLVDKHGIPREEQGKIIKIKIAKPSIDL